MPIKAGNARCAPASSKAPISKLSGQTICPVCAEKAGSRLSRPTNSTVLRGLLYGAGAALACAICYAIFTLWVGMWAIAAIAVGYVVGRAVRIGSNGLGGRRCQIIAIVLTYLSITTGYIPVLIKEVRDHAHAKVGTAAGTGTSQKEESKQAEPQTKDVAKVPPLGAWLLGMALVAGVALISPFLMLMDGARGIIGVAIIAFGLLQAWRHTARPLQVLAGPYKLEQNPSLT